MKPWLALSASLFVLPLVLAFFAAPRQRSSFASAVLRVPVALAVDLLLLTTLSRVLAFSVAVVVSRVAYALAFAGWRARGSRRVRWSLPAVAAAALASAVAVRSYSPLSGRFTIWDSQWHIPLSASLEGQRLPFHNVYNVEPLHYHVGGDIVAAEFRALSFDHLSSAAALALSHDVFIGLAVAWLVLLASALGARSLTVAVLGSVAIALHGAIPRALDGATTGEPFFAFAEVSYRPHVPVAFFAAIMIVGAVVTRATAPSVRGARAALIAGMLVACVNDEASVGVYGLALAATWLVYPTLLGASRRAGIGMLFAMLLAVTLPNAFISGTIGPGGVVRSAVWALPPRFAGLEGVDTPLTTLAAWRFAGYLLAAPIVACCALVVARLQRRPHVAAPAALFAGLTLLTALVFGTCLTVNGSGGEAQRFFVSAFVGPLVTVTLLGPSLGEIARALVALTMGIPAVASVYHLASHAVTLRGSEYEAGAHNANMPVSLFDADCAKVADSTFGESPRRLYVDHSGFMLYAACRSLYAPGRVHGGWHVSLDPNVEPAQQTAWLKEQGATQEVEAACWRDRPSDVVCSDLKARGKCAPNGTAFLRCTLQQ